MTTPDGFPTDVVGVDLQASSVSLRVDAGLYPLEALYGAAYVFIDRAFVFLEKPDDAHFRATLSPKKGGADETALRALSGEFANELLSCAWRQQIIRENRATIEAVTTQALAGAMGPPSLDDLAAFDFTEENFEDPLGIAMSWEDKYKKKDKPAVDDPAKTDATAAAPTAESGLSDDKSGGNA